MLGPLLADVAPAISPPRGRTSSRFGVAARGPIAAMPPLDCMTRSGGRRRASRQPVCEPVEVAAPARPDVGVDDGGREALELAELGDDLVRQGDRGVRLVLGEELTGAQLVARVQEREQEADADRLDARRP